MVDIFIIGSLISTGTLGVMTIFLLLSEFSRQYYIDIFKKPHSLKTEIDNAEIQLEKINQRRFTTLLISSLFFLGGLMLQIIDTIKK